MTEQEKILMDDIYESLVQIQAEEEVELSAKAFIADCLAEKLYKLGYRKNVE